jgi:hypothetical protein
MLGLAPTVVYMQFLVDRTQFIFVLFDFPPVSYYSVSLAYLFICGLVDASFHQSCIFVLLWSGGCTKCRLEATVSLLPRNELIVSKKESYPITGLDRPLGLQEVKAPRISRQSAHDSKKKSYLEFVSLGEVCTDLCSVPHRFVYFSVVCHIYFSLFTLVPPRNCCGCVLK